MTAPTSGAPYGIITSDEALVPQLADGTDINAVWETFRALLADWNSARDTLTSVLSFNTTVVGEAVPQSVNIGLFERASELGVSRAAQGPGTALMVGYDFDTYDLAQRMTARFLMNADQRQVDAVMNAILAADSQLTTGRVLRRLLDPTETKTPEGFRCFGLYNGTDGITPPPFAGRTFSE